MYFTSFKASGDKAVNGGCMHAAACGAGTTIIINTYMPLFARLKLPSAKIMIGKACIEKQCVWSAV